MKSLFTTFLLFTFLISSAQKELTVEEKIRQIGIAYTQQDYQRIVTLYESIDPADVPEGSKTTLLSFVSGAYGALGNQEKASKLMSDLMKNMYKQAGYEELGESIGQSIEESTQQQEEYKRQQAANEVQDEQQMINIQERLGVTNNNSSPTIDYSKMFSQGAKHMKLMIESSDMSPEKKEEALKLIQSENRGDWMRVAQLMMGASDEEVLENLKELNKKTGDFVDVDLDGETDLAKAYEKLGGAYDDFSNKSAMEYNRLRDGLTEYHYRPDVIIHNISSMVNMYDPFEWVSDEQFIMLEQLKKEYEESSISYETAADQFVSRWSSKTNMPDTVKEQLKEQFIQTLNQHELAILKMIDGNEKIKQAMIQFESLVPTISPFDAYMDACENLESLPVYKAIVSEMGKVSSLKNVTELNELRHEYNQLEEMSKYRDIMMNVFVKVYSNYKMDIFSHGKNQVLSYNSLLASKSSDYRAKLFLLEGAKNCSDSKARELYGELRSIMDELGEAHLMTDSLLQVSGWTEDKFEKQISKASDIRKELYKLITADADFVPFAQRWIITWEDVQNKLEKDQVFIDIHRVQSLEDSSDYSYIYVLISPDSEPQLFIRDKEDYDIERSFTGYRKMVNSKMEFPNAFSTFFGPISSQVQSARTIYLSGDGIYHAISFEGLKMPGSEEYFFEKHNLIRLMEVSDIRMSNTGSAEKSGKIHLFGNPNYRSKAEQEANPEDNGYRTFVTRARLRPLKGTVKEVDSIASICQKAGISRQVYMEDDANEQNFVSLKEPRVIHLATHGKFYGNLGKDEGSFNQSSRFRFLENPMLKSHIYLAGASTSLNNGSSSPIDGIITAEEVAHMDFTETELVVLSACESGLGELAIGEGVYGLQRAFLTAGSDAIIMTLWEVDDQSASRMMISFYHYWLVKGYTKREAFDQARADLKAIKPHPNFWAPFILIEGA